MQVAKSHMAGTSIVLSFGTRVLSGASLMLMTLVLAAGHAQADSYLAIQSPHFPNPPSSTASTLSPTNQYTVTPSQLQAPAIPNADLNASARANAPTPVPSIPAPLPLPSMPLLADKTPPAAVTHPTSIAEEPPAPSEAQAIPANFTDVVAPRAAAMSKDESGLRPEILRAWTEEFEAMERENQTLRAKLNLGVSDRLSDIRIDAVAKIHEDVLRKRIAELENELATSHDVASSPPPSKTNEDMISTSKTADKKAKKQPHAAIIQP